MNVVRLAAVALLVVHFGLTVGSKLNESTTSDELVHLTAGFSYWEHHDYRLHPENGNLPQRWAALPTWIAGASFPELKGNDYWRTNDAWVIGHQFFYETGEDHFPRLMRARAMIALFSVGIGIMVFLWSRRFFGNVGALISLGFFTFSPNFLAHGALATSDVCMTFFFLASIGAWWRHLHSPNLRMWCLSAVVFGLAFVAKYSAVLLIPMLGMLAITRIFSSKPLLFGRWKFVTRGGKLGAISVSLLAHGAMATLIIWAFYGFRYPATNSSLPPSETLGALWTAMEQGIGVFRHPVHTARVLQLLPEGFLYGFAYVIKTVAVRSAFLNGEYSMVGWPTFFIWTFTLKSTLALLIASAVAFWALLRRPTDSRSWREGTYVASPLIVLFVVYWISSLTSHLNIGHRHLLPIYPVLFIGIGALGTLCSMQRMRDIALAVGLLGWHIASSLSVAPHFLAYFNAVAGGPQNGWRHLVDSSLDWGQDLPGLKSWLDEHAKEQPVFLSYFGTGQPTYYDIRARRLPFVNNFKFAPQYVELEPGIYCVSATMLQQVYSSVPGSTWTTELEDEFQTLRKAEPLLKLYADSLEQRASMERDTPRDQWHKGIARFDALRFARLCHYLRVREPDDTVGYSILIYRLSAGEIFSATAGSLRDWSQLIEQTVLADK